VIDLFEQIRAEDSNHPDPEGLLASSSDALKLEQRVATLYDRGQRHMKAEEWQQALECFEEVRRLEPNYREVQALLARARQQESAGHAEKAEASERQRRQTAGRSTDQAERVQPDYSTDSQLQSPLPMLGRNWWALALVGLINASHGLGDSLVLPSGSGAFYRSLASSLLIAIGVFTIIASSTAHSSLLLRTQGIISGLAGLVALLSGAIEPPYPPSNVSTFTEALQNLPFFVVHISAFALWGICIGIIQIIVAIRLGWNFRDMRLMLVSGTFLLLYSIYVFSSLFRWADAIPWLLGILLLASGISLVAFAFRVRQREDGEVGA
jgi:uncharacterized membrane protein HdeD (DUF308 family)